MAEGGRQRGMDMLPVKVKLKWNYRFNSEKQKREQREERRNAESNLWWTILKRSTLCCCFHLRNSSSSYHGQGHPCFYLLSLRALHRSSLLTPSKVTQDAEDSCSQAQNFSWTRTEERQKDIDRDLRREERGVRKEGDREGRRGWLLKRGAKRCVFWLK